MQSWVEVSDLPTVTRGWKPLAEQEKSVETDSRNEPPLYDIRKETINRVSPNCVRVECIAVCSG